MSSLGTVEPTVPRKAARYCRLRALVEDRTAPVTHARLAVGKCRAERQRRIPSRTREGERPMSPLDPRDYQPLWDLIAHGISEEGRDFPGMFVGNRLAELFQAEVVDACEIGILWVRSRHLATYPNKAGSQCWQDPDRFHKYLISHPVARYYSCGGKEPAVRIVDVMPRREWRASTAYGFLRESTGMTEQLIIPVAARPEAVCALAVMRASTAFDAHDLAMGHALGCVLAGVHRLHNRQLCTQQIPRDDAPQVHLTPRETQVLHLWQFGLTASGIGHSLGITSRTVDKHAENLRAKLGTTDRTTSVLRAQALGLLGPPTDPGRCQTTSDGAAVADG